MNFRTRQYLFGIIFAGVAVYYMLEGEVLEGSLYIMAGLAFIFNTLSGEPRLAGSRQVLVTITWVLIIITGILFLYLLQSRYF